MQQGMTNALTADTSCLKKLVVCCLSFPRDEQGRSSRPSIYSKSSRGFNNDITAELLRPAAGPPLTPE